eukprot:1442884-Pyramimonas_sp.AAC.1
MQEGLLSEFLLSLKTLLDSGVLTDDGYKTAVAMCVQQAIGPPPGFVVPSTAPPQSPQPPQPPQPPQLKANGPNKIESVADLKAWTDAHALPDLREDA